MNVVSIIINLLYSCVKDYAKDESAMCMYDQTMS